MVSKRNFSINLNKVKEFEALKQNIKSSEERMLSVRSGKGLFRTLSTQGSSKQLLRDKQSMKLQDLLKPEVLQSSSTKNLFSYFITKSKVLEAGVLKNPNKSNHSNLSKRRTPNPLSSQEKIAKVDAKLDKVDKEILQTVEKEFETQKAAIKKEKKDSKKIKFSNSPKFVPVMKRFHHLNPRAKHLLRTKYSKNTLSLPKLSKKPFKA